MEQESFEDSESAEYLNSNFVAVKVDREERPDIDAVYMAVCQALTGSGGWPMTIIMTPEQKPFFAGTYFPKRTRYGHLGLMELLAAVKEKWDNGRESLVNSCDKIIDFLNNRGEADSNVKRPGRDAVEKAARQLRAAYDNRFGGFGRAPKFPTPHNMMLLLRYYIHNPDANGDALAMVGHTLKSMYKGGIFDHVGFGFSRYSTDEKWLAPHFEKMLYDNALMTAALLECFQITGDQFYKAVAEKTLKYISMEMISPEGGFYCSEDADIDGEEGKFYTYTPDEITDVLGKSDGESFCRRYDVTRNGNFEGKSIPNLLSDNDVWLPDADMEKILTVLREYRKRRYSLHKDDKILTSWNALMIVAHAKAYRALGEAGYLDSAVKAREFIRRWLTGPDGELLISCREGRAKGHGLLDDYAFLAWACLELYDSTFDVKYLEEACDLTGQILSRFADGSGGFYLSAESGERLITRPKEWYDGAVPSGNSVAAYCLARLAGMTGESRWRDAAEKQLMFYGDMFDSQPGACTFALLALMLEEYPARGVVCVTEASQKEKLAKIFGGIFMPQTSVIVKTPEDAERLERLAPFVKDYGKPPEKEYAFYLCQNQTCETPVYDVAELLGKLR